MNELKTPTLERQPRRARSLPVLGILPFAFRDPLNYLLETASNANAALVQIDVGPRHFYLVSHPDQIKYILQDNSKNYVKGYETVRPLLGQGLVTSDGELWLRQRRLMQPLFNRPSLALIYPQMTGAATELIAAWHRRPNPDQPLDMAVETMLLTQTIILRTMFSTGLGKRSADAAEIFEVVLQGINRGLFMPFEFIRNLPTRSNRRFQRALKEADALIYQLIEERCQKGAPLRPDLLTTLMETRDENGQGMSTQQVRDEVMTIFLAGHETTATLLAWTFYLLGQHPQIEQQVRAELGQVLGGRIPELDDLNRLVFTRQVLDEALRLYPPAWMFARRSVKADEVGGYPIPPNSMIFLSPYVTHHLEQFWEEPFRFYPQRFAQDAAQDRPRFSYFPFGGGPRQCIGMGFTQMEAPALLAMLLQAFRFQPVAGSTVRPAPSATLRPKPGVPMKVTPIT